MTLDEYHNRPTHSAFHDFTTSCKPPPNLRSLLGLGLKFIPTPKQSNNYRFLHARTFEKLRRSLHLKFHFADAPIDSDYNPRIYIQSSWTPPHWTFPSQQLNPRLDDFEAAMKKLFKPKRGKTNLLPHQRRALDFLQTQNDLLVVPTDKNLGPAIIERDRYIRLIMSDHLHNTATYKRLNPHEQQHAQQSIADHLKQWIKTHKNELSKSDLSSLRIHLKNNVQPFARFYGILKAHKAAEGRPLSTRPIVSCPGSLLYPIGAWLDVQLQKPAQQQRTYIKNSYHLKQLLLEMDIPVLRARLFTADAVSMYTNIPTNQAIRRISTYLRQHPNFDIPVEASIDALRLVMKNNIFTFGDMVFKQKTGTAMGTPPACAYAVLYYAVHEDPVADRYNEIILMKRFIDDMIGIWVSNPDPVLDQQHWEAFQRDLNEPNGLQWEVSERSHQVNFMDLTISLHEGKITTTLYEKPLNLHLYIPPTSAHPPGLLPGVVYGTLFRIQTLCSDPADKLQRTRTFFRRLLLRGYQSSQLLPLFKKAIERAAQYAGPTERANIEYCYVILHLQYHPQDPPSSAIQRAWKQLVAEPQYKMKLCNMKNPHTKKRPNIQRLIIAYSRPMNLGNYLTHRNIAQQTGPQASTYFNV